MTHLLGQGIFDLGQFEFRDWEPAKDASANNGPLCNINAPHIDPSKIVIGVESSSDSGIEWRFGPSQHIGAMSPQLLYRTTTAALSNSFLTVIPRSQTSLLRDVDLVARMFTPNARHKSMLHIYQGWVIARLASLRQHDYYMAAIYRNDTDTSDVGSIWRVSCGSRIFKIAATFLGNRIEWTKPWHCRLNLNGNALKAKWWSYDVIEPQPWDLSGSDNFFAQAGMLGFAATVHGAIANNIWGLDWYAWSSDPDVSAPIYPCD